MDLSVVVVSYNTRDLLRECLRSILRETTTIAFDVIVVDNASTDGSATMVSAEFPSVSLIPLDENIGFGRACNLGVARSIGECVVLLNPDTVVRDRALEALLAFGRSHPEAGLTGGRTLRPTGEVDPSSCWGRPTLWSLFCYASGLSTLFRRSLWLDPESLGRWPRDSVRSVDVVTGCLLLASRPVWNELGGFDERFFLYGEDADLSLRARALGYRPMITPEATVTHVVGAASASSVWKGKRLLAGKVTLLDKHWSPIAARFGRALLLAGVAARSGGARLRKKQSPWIGLWDERAIWLQGYPPCEVSGSIPSFVATP
jgi:GT2 family glycosyltransferase